MKKGRGYNVKYLPLAFTEHGAIMAAMVLNSPRAVQLSVYVVRAFVKLREVLASNTTLARRLRFEGAKCDLKELQVTYGVARLGIALGGHEKQRQRAGFFFR